MGNEVEGGFGVVDIVRSLKLKTMPFYGETKRVTCTRFRSPILLKRLLQSQHWQPLSFSLNRPTRSIFFFPILPLHPMLFLVFPYYYHTIPKPLNDIQIVRFQFYENVYENIYKIFFFIHIYELSF